MGRGIRLCSCERKKIQDQQACVHEETAVTVWLKAKDKDNQRVKKDKSAENINFHPEKKSSENGWTK